MSWDHDTYDAALRACWDDDDQDGGREHCIRMIARALLGKVVASPNGARVLDLGCGVGRILFPLASRSPSLRFYGIDTSPAMLGHAQDQRTALALEGVQLDVWLGSRIPPLDFAAAYSVVVLQHLPAHDVAAYLVELHEALVHEGVFRFQFVEDGDEGPLNHPLRRDDLSELLADARFDRWEFEGDDRFPSWTWCTAVNG